jgi:hypothetical protein
MVTMMTCVNVLVDVTFRLHHFPALFSTRRGALYDGKRTFFFCFL